MNKVSNIIKYAVLAAVTLIFIFPLVWVFYNSFKTNSELFENPWALPGSINFENYIYAWKQANIGQYFLNSIIVCVFCPYQTEMEIIECCYDDFFGGDDDTHSFHFNTAVFNVFKGGDH